MIVTPQFNMDPMTASEFEDLLAAQRRAMVRDIPTSDATAATETPTLTRTELAEMLCDRVGLNKQESKEMVEAFFEVMRDALEGGESVKLAGFGSFQLRDKRPRPGRNPKTGIATLIAARRVVTFRSGPTLKARLEANREQRHHD
jgi:integration host factor subunit alpha